MNPGATANENPEVLAETLSREPAEHEPALAPDAPEREAVSDGALLHALEQRVRHLEEVVAPLQDTQQLETRIASRVLEQVKNDRPASSTVRESAAIMLGAGRHILPAAVGALQAQADAAEKQPAAVPKPERQPWLIIELFADLRTLFRMARDPLYRAVWVTRMFVPLVLLAAIATSWLWLQLVPGFGLFPNFLQVLLIKIIDLLLAFILCKALQREIRRYREAVPDPASVRRP